MEYSWPGNVRELEHVLEHSFIVCNQSIITPDHLPPDLKVSRSEGEKGDYHLAILKALEKSRWNKTEAARLLEISRQSLYRKIKEYKIMED